MVFRRDGTASVNWNFGPETTPFNLFDFESVAVHELGHAHQLGHIIAPEKVMHFAITNGGEVRSLDPVSDIDGGQQVLTNFGQLGLCGESPMTPLIAVPVEDQELPDGFRLAGAYPNPFADEARLTVTVETEQFVTVVLHDVLGRVVRTVFEGRITPARQEQIAIEGHDLTPGVYLVRITGEGFSTTKPVTRL